MSRMSRIHTLRSGSPNAAKGDASSKEVLAYWSRRASKNSYHGPGSQESGTDRLGTQDKNHAGGTFMPNVRREG